MVNQSAVLNRWLPYRLQTLEALRIALRHFNAGNDTKPLAVHIDGKLVMEGTAAGIINPMMEAGVIHARALLEFLGLAVKEKRLIKVPRRRPDDICIEHLTLNGAALSMVEPQAAIRSYEGPSDEAERALVTVFDLANKGLAHLTWGIRKDGWSSHDLDIACRGITALVVGNVYRTLGAPVPDYQISSRSASTD